MSEIIEMASNLCREFEGFSGTPYLCPAGVWTIGYGTVIRDKNERMLTSKDTKPNMTMSQGEAEKALADHIGEILPVVQRLIEPPLEHNQWAALLDFAYNLGTGSLQASTLRKVINRHEYDDVPKQLRRWVFAGGRKLRGLERRRNAEIRLWEENKCF